MALPHTSVVHALAARLRPDADRELVATATDAAAALRTAPGVMATRVGCSSSQLIVAVWLPNPGALEPFAASPPHMNFVMRGLAPLIEGMWSISVATDREPPTESAMSICAFAVPEADGVFEWQVRRQLELIGDLPGTSWSGPTVEERERYRAGGAVLFDGQSEDDFNASLRAASDESLTLELASAPLIAEGPGS